MKKQSRDRVAAIKAGVMRHIVGETRAAAKRAAKVATPAEPAKPATPAALAVPRAGMKISDTALRNARALRRAKAPTRSADTVSKIFAPYVPPPGVIPKNVSGDMKIAMDEAVATANQLSEWGGLSPYGTDTLFAEGIGFLGYAYLAELTQRPEFRRISERIATEMTRKWIKLQVTSQDDAEKPIAKNKKPKPPAVPGMESTEEEETSTPEDVQRKVNVTAEGGDADDESSPDDVQHSIEQKKKSEKAKKLQEVEDELTRLHVKQCFYNMAEWDGWFGRSHIFVDLGVDTSQNNNELASTIGTGRNSKGKVRKGTLKRFTCVEPMWCYPAFYNANNPLDAGFYNPQHWYVNGIQVHKTRLLTFVGREVPDILKPAYAFGGLSMSQMAKPYVDNWLRTRQAVCDLIESFSVSGVYTNMAGTLQDGGDEAIKRIELFNITRANAGAFMLDKDTEEYFNVSTPLGTLDALQAQSQEQMSSITGIPLVVLLGITPTGLNASSEGEMRAFYDWINAYQEKFFRDKLQTVIELVQLNLWGKIDKEISFIFEPLWSMTEKEVAEVDKLEAETDQIRIDSGVIHPEEARSALANEPNSRYADINVADVPEPPADPMGMDPFGNGDGGEGSDGEKDGGDDSNPGGDKPGVAQDEFPYAIFPEGASDQWEEGKHPRATDGKFGSGSGGSLNKTASPTAKKSDGSSKGKTTTGGVAKLEGKLTPTERAYLDSYSGDEFLSLNRKLRSGDAKASSVAKLDSAIGKSTLTPGTKLYRGISKDALKQMVGGNTIEAGQVLSDAGFLSTSTDRNIAGMNSIGGVVMEIEVGENQRGLDVGSISRNQHEKEVILPRGAKLEVLGLRAPKKVGDPIIVRVGTRNEGTQAADQAPLAAAANSGTPVVLPGEDDKDDEEDVTRIIVGQDDEAAVPPVSYEEFLSALSETAAAKDTAALGGLLQVNSDWTKRFVAAATPECRAMLARLVPDIDLPVPEQAEKSEQTEEA